MRPRTPPIPAWALPHTVWVRVPLDTGGYGGEYADPVAIRRVRYDPVAEVRATDYQLQNAVRGTLYIDARNSLGAFAIPAGSLVRLEGEESWACAASCAAYSPDERTHHWEVELR